MIADQGSYVAFGNEESYGLLVVGGALKNFDTQFRFYDAEMTNVIQQVVEWEPDFIFLSPLTTFFPPARHVTKEIKKRLPNVTSVFGGHHAMSCPDIVELPEIDVVVIGPVKGSIENIFSGLH